MVSIGVVGLNLCFAVPIYLAMSPTSIGGVSWGGPFEWKFVNYTPILVGTAPFLLFVSIPPPTPTPAEDVPGLLHT